MRDNSNFLSGMMRRGVTESTMAATIFLPFMKRNQSKYLYQLGKFLLLTLYRPDRGMYLLYRESRRPKNATPMESHL